MAVGVTLRDFCENTSVHGLAFVVESKSSVLKRLAWMTIFLMCLSYAIMQIKESIDGRLRKYVVFYIPYARHYKPRLVYFLPHFQRPFMYCDLWSYVWLVFKSGF